METDSSKTATHESTDYRFLDIPREIPEDRNAEGHKRFLQLTYKTPARLALKRKLQNMRLTREKTKSKRSKYLGVYKTRNGKWAVAINSNHIRKYFGRYENEDDAGHKADEVYKALYGPDCKGLLNFPDE